MRMLLALSVFVALAGQARSQPADCPPDPDTPPPVSVPLQLNLRGLPGVPSGIGGQAYVAAPLTDGGMACTDQPPPPRDILRGEPGDVLHGDMPSGGQGDLLRGP